jgi:hypothetical protein
MTTLIPFPRLRNADSAPRNQCSVVNRHLRMTMVG